MRFPESLEIWQALYAKLGRCSFSFCFSQSVNCRGRREDIDSELPRGRRKVPAIEGHDRICAAVHRCFEYHVIVWVGQCRTPQEGEMHGLAHECHDIKQGICPPTIRPR